MREGLVHCRPKSNFPQDLPVHGGAHRSQALGGAEGSPLDESPRRRSRRAREFVGSKDKERQQVPRPGHRFASRQSPRGPQLRASPFHRPQPRGQAGRAPALQPLGSPGFWALPFPGRSTRGVLRGEPHEQRATASLRLGGRSSKLPTCSPDGGKAGAVGGRGPGLGASPASRSASGRALPPPGTVDSRLAAPAPSRPRLPSPPPGRPGSRPARAPPLPAALLPPGLTVAAGGGLRAQRAVAGHAGPQVVLPHDAQRPALEGPQEQHLLPLLQHGGGAAARLRARGRPEQSGGAGGGEAAASGPPPRPAAWPARGSGGPALPAAARAALAPGWRVGGFSWPATPPRIPDLPPPTPASVSPSPHCLGAGRWPRGQAKDLGKIMYGS